MKIVSYDPNEIKDVPSFFNKYLDEFANEDYLMFIFNDIANEISNKDEFNKQYASLLKILDLPFAFYPYYTHFNKILPDMISKPNPRAHINSKFGVFDVVASLSYGMLIVDIQKLKSINFKFNPNYKASFYVQDLAHQCYVNKLWVSETYFLDICNSFTMLNKNITEGYNVNSKSFAEEKERFFNENKTENEQINDFIKNLKAKYGNETAVNQEQSAKENA